MKLLQLILAVFFPPVSVAVERGMSGSLLLNIILTLIGWVPGVIHALWVLLSGQSAPHTSYA